MNIYEVKEFTHSVTALLLLGLFSMSPICADDSFQNNSQADSNTDYFRSTTESDSTTKTRFITGVTVTGFNSVLGKPFYNWGGQFGTLGFPSVAEYNKNGTLPIPIDQNTPHSVILATSVAPEFLALAGKTRDDVKPEWENVPLREVPVNVDFQFVERKPIPGIFTVPPTEISQAWPANQITLGQWLKARGLAKIVCKDGQADLKLILREFIPNRMYGVWATLGGQNLSTFPMGGSPNFFVTDEHGNASYKRKLNYCPMDKSTSSRPLLVMNVLYYSNHQYYGAVPEPARVNGYWVGLVTHNHMQFPVNVRRL